MLWKTKKSHNIRGTLKKYILLNYDKNIITEVYEIYTIYTYEMSNII